ncbi:uncharacterized protein LOC105935744 [Fundulus heteroclitus]|uniref:uncharacterized protein LOC105935744 n=1 Tax=Fundulus heteroclitus TaxID=8078 RepID=UPI00165A6104|nr:uncharacterized protein LOC105935744 [Fundulus heteroclitus]
MELEGISQTHCSQCPAPSAKVRRNVEVRLVESRNNKIEPAASGPEVFLQLSSYACKDCGLCMARDCQDEGEREDGGDQCPCAVDVRGEDKQHARDKAATAAAQTPKTKPKARAQVTRGQRSDGDEEDSLRDQCPVSLIRVTGSVSWADADPRGSASRQATASDGASLDPSDLCKQLHEMKLQTERERRKNTRDVHQPCIRGLPGSRAPDCPLSGARRTRCLHTAGILPQEQIRVKGFSGTPFRLP